MTVVSIHQPSYLPWLGYFNKICNADIFVHLDSVPYSRGYYYNRNRIKTKKGEQWLTVPVLWGGHLQPIKDVEIDDKKRWQKKHWKSIQQNYKKAEFWDDSLWLEILIREQDWTYLSGMSICLCDVISRSLEIKTEFIRSSSLDVQGSKSKLLVNICEKLEADTYISGIGGKDYLDEKLFQEKGIEVVYQDFKHPVYKQLHGEFIPNMSIIDLLFNEGKNSINMINKKI